MVAVFVEEELLIESSNGTGAKFAPGLVVWFTGLSSAGKSTIARAVRNKLAAAGEPVELLDGDEIRTNLCRGLGFSREDRDENVRRIGYVAALLARHGVTVLVAAIAPYRAVREEIRRLCGPYIEVYVNASLSVCESRDVKGLYRKARSGEVKNFTGVSDPYEAPLNPDVECRTGVEDLDACVRKVLAAIQAR
ncbi:MAG TPA: adenylyl-sulfate kinase [Bryobacteraceae bacterium]|jgi:adenylylsulfate kinase|nr:adenylyl-sulfate kinase [Bryobacteraceae bacterium]